SVHFYRGVPMRCSVEKLCRDWIVAAFALMLLLTLCSAALASHAAENQQPGELAAVSEVPGAPEMASPAELADAPSVVCCPHIAGTWEGCWEAHCSGHSGKLRAVIRPCGQGQFV